MVLLFAQETVVEKTTIVCGEAAFGLRNAAVVSSKATSNRDLGPFAS
jgi:hypothetical protein